MSTNPFDASASMLGYLYQIRYALLMAIRKFDLVDDPDMHHISIEKLDDISFDSSGMPIELLQTKYHGSPANLTDKSPDLWKTFRIWAEYYKNYPVKYSSTNLLLITTEISQADSLASYLSINESTRNIDDAFSRIKELLKDSPSEVNEKGYLAIAKLSDAELRLLLNNISIIESSSNISQLYQDLKRSVQLYFDKAYIDASLERLEGAWYKLAIKNLNNDIESICLGEIQEKIEDIRRQINPDNLPNDFSNTPLEDFGDVRRDHYFLKQIKLFTNDSYIIKLAIENFYRSYHQLTKWSSEGLLIPGEVKSYQEKVLKEWESTYSLSRMRCAPVDESSKISLAQDVYIKCQEDKIIPIRARFSGNFVCRGTYHYLSDEKKIWWHPEHSDLIKEDEGNS